MRPINKIVVHVSDSPDSMDIGAEEIRDWHLERGWSDIGYHAVVRRSGKIELGREESRAGAHVKGENHDSLGIVWVGRDEPTDEQLKSLKRKILAWMEKYDLDVEDVYGHYEFDEHKTCPNLDMDDFRSSLGEAEEDNSLSAGEEEYLPDGPSEDEIDVTLEDIEDQILDD